MSRREFSTKVRAQAIKRATDPKGVTRCEACSGVTKAPEVDHVNPDGLTGEPTLANAMVLCGPCHKAKTAGDVKDIAKAKRREARHIGAIAPKRPIR